MSNDYNNWLEWYSDKYTTFIPTDDAGEPVNSATLLSWRTWQEACKQVREIGYKNEKF